MSFLHIYIYTIPLHFSRYPLWNSVNSVAEDAIIELFLHHFLRSDSELLLQLILVISSSHNPMSMDTSTLLHWCISCNIDNPHPIKYLQIFRICLVRILMNVIYHAYESRTPVTTRKHGSVGRSGHGNLVRTNVPAKQRKIPWPRVIPNDSGNNHSYTRRPSSRLKGNGQHHWCEDIKLRVRQRNY